MPRCSLPGCRSLAVQTVADIYCLQFLMCRPVCSRSSWRKSLPPFVVQRQPGVIHLLGVKTKTSSTYADAGCVVVFSTPVRLSHKHIRERGMTCFRHAPCNDVDDMFRAGFTMAHTAHVRRASANKGPPQIDKFNFIV